MTDAACVCLFCFVQCLWFTGIDVEMEKQTQMNLIKHGGNVIVPLGAI